MKVSKNDFQYMLECMERDLATLLVEKRGMTIRQALSILYDSDTYRLLQNPNTGLYFQSPQYVYSYLQEEIEQGKLATLNVELCAGRNVEWLPLAILNVVIGCAACQSKNGRLCRC